MRFFVVLVCALVFCAAASAEDVFPNRHTVNIKAEHDAKIFEIDTWEGSNQLDVWFEWGNLEPNKYIVRCDKWPHKHVVYHPFKHGLETVFVADGSPLGAAADSVCFESVKYKDRK